jgi:hypothetical protein
MGNGVDRTDTSLSPISSRTDEYFANLETRECAFEVWARIEEYYNEMRRTGRFALYRNSYSNFYMGWIYRATMYRSGEQGELTRSFWNHERNLLRHLKVQTTQNKIAYKAQVLNSNAKSANVVEFANGLADRYSQAPQYDLDGKGKQSVEDTLVWGESSVVALWNRFKGDPVAQDPQSGQILRDGDMDYFNVTPMDQVINCSHQSRDLLQWRCIRRWVNKYDLAAMYPELAGVVGTYNDSESSYATKLVSLMHHDSETIPIFYFFHDKTPAVPQGRLLVMADPDCIFEDGPLDKGEGQKGYDHIPVYDNIVETMQGSPYGYTVAFDLIPLQQALNELVSAVTSNNVNFATQCIMAMSGSNLQWQGLASGMSFVEYDPKVGPNGKPEALNLLHSQPETYKFIEMTIQNMETLAGVNSMIRGNPQEDVTSGQYAALVTVQSVLFNSGLQKGYARLMENLMTGTIKTIKKNMIGKKIARIVGETSEPYLKEFTSADLQDIESVSVQLVNPMLQTPAGKMAMADSLMKTGLIKDPQQYIGVYTDGDLPQLYRRQETQLKLIKQENEAILKGQIPEVAITDNHVAHILEHTQVFDNIDARMNPNAPHVVAGMAHVQKHMNKLLGGVDPQTGIPEGSINPVLAGIIGDPTLPMGTPSALQLPPMQPPPPPGNPGQNVPGRTNGEKQPQSPPGTASQPSQTLPQTGAPGPQPAMNGAPQ